MRSNSQPQAWQDALDPALVRRLLRRARRPGLCQPWQAQAMLERHAGMVSGLPLAELVSRAEILADGRGAWAPIVYARPAAPPELPATAPGRPAVAGPGERPGASRPDAARNAPARREVPPIVRATPVPAAPHLPAAVVGSAPPPAGAAPHARPWREPAASPSAAGGLGPLVAGPPAHGPVWPSAPAPPSRTGTTAAAGGRAAPAVPPAPPAVRPTALATVRPQGTPGLVLVTAMRPPPPPGTQPQWAPVPDAPPPLGPPASRPVVRVVPVRNANRAAPPRPAAAGETGLAPLPVVRERVGPSPALGGTWSPGAGTLPVSLHPAVPAVLPLAHPPAPGTGTGTGAAPAAPVVADGGEAVRRPPQAAAGARQATVVPAARGPQARPQRAVLARGDVDRIVDKVQRKLLNRLAIEGERRGAAR